MRIEDIFREAQACHLRGQLVQAEERYRQVLAIDPRAVGALEGLGVLLFQQNRAAGAVEYFSRAVPLNPRSARLQANLGEALRTVKQLDKAQEHLSAAVTLEPTLAQTWNSLGLLAADYRRHAEAESRFREAIRLNPRVMAARVNLANALHSLGRLDEAVAELRVVIEAEPNNILALTNLGQMLCETDPKDLGNAESLCRRAVQLAPHLASALNGLGKVLRFGANWTKPGPAMSGHWSRARATPPHITISGSSGSSRAAWTKHSSISSPAAPRVPTTRGSISTWATCSPHACAGPKPARIFRVRLSAIPQTLRPIMGWAAC